MAENIQKINKPQRIVNILVLASTIGIDNINRIEISKKHGVSERTTGIDIKSIYEAGINTEVVEKAKVDLYHMHKNVFKQLQAELLRTKGKDKVTIVNALMNQQDKMISYFEKFGLKEVIAEKQDVNMNVHAAVKELEEFFDKKS